MRPNADASGTVRKTLRKLLAWQGGCGGDEISNIWNRKPSSQEIQCSREHECESNIFLSGPMKYKIWEMYFKRIELGILK